MCGINLRASFITLAAAIFSYHFLYAQVPLKSTEEEYFDFLSLTGTTERPTVGYRTLSDSVWEYSENSINESIWEKNNLGTTKILWQSQKPSSNWFTKGIKKSVSVKVYGPEWYNSYNTTAPYGQNDGALWQGKGYNTSFSAGARIECCGLEATFKPQLCWSQNLNFDTLPGTYGSIWSYFWGEPGDSASASIDLPQRFGDTSFWNFDWGESEIRYSWNTFTLGFGTQNPWLGPAWLNPMLGSNNAGGYPKLDLGLRKTRLVLPIINADAGFIEARLWTGRLEESDYFDSNKSNDYRMLTGISLSYSPSFLEGLTLGINRIFMTTWNSKNLKYIGRLFKISHGNDTTGDGEDQKFAVYMDWLFPSAGFEFYGEVGIDDYTDKKISNPFHTAIYTFGLKKSLNLYLSKKITGELIFEFSNFEMSQDFQFEWQYGGYYTHSKITQGYTNRGQILGAGSGYAGNSQFLGLRIYYQKGSTMIFGHRHCPDNNYILSKSIGTSLEESKNWRAKYKTYISFGINQIYYIKTNFQLTASFTLSAIEYADYSNKETFFNFHPELGIKYYF
ncbi:hypothetical protein DYE49_05290 [Treponema rectale]|uniref:Capsule assembly protein Wzi n=1 Tax=Treponema rectale TaxID=744512 RepID=A0A840S761_9SPIR|nr:capsule assembly Wzi family protein [Treponema rectale]MBB5218409.1 hypothetical protein [Treponema rectale]QOS39899.1 hypothetical protein DYE49_05290 [Treponema rectale]